MAFDFSDPSNAFLAQLGAGLLAAGGPSSRPSTLGQAFGTALPSAIQSQQAALEQRQRAAMAKRQQDMDEVKFGMQMTDWQDRRDSSTRQQAEMQRKAEAMARFAQTLPPEHQQRFMLDPEPYIKGVKLGPEDSIFSPVSQNPMMRGVPKKTEFERSLDLAGFAPGSPQWNAATRARVLKETTHAPGVAVNVDAKQETEAAKAFGKMQGEMLGGIQRSAFEAPGKVAKLDQMASLLDQINTGAGTKLGMNVASAARVLGFNLDPNLSKKEAFEAISNELALLAKNTADGANLMPGAMSEADRVFLTQLVPNLGKTPEANRLGVEMLKRQNKRAMEVAKLTREYRKRNGTVEGVEDFLADYAERNPIYSDLMQRQQPRQNTQQLGGGVKFLGFE